MVRDTIAHSAMEINRNTYVHDLPTSQTVPVNPELQEHVYPLPRLEHVPPCRQGLLEHDIFTSG